MLSGRQALRQNCLLHWCGMKCMRVCCMAGVGGTAAVVHVAVKSLSQCTIIRFNDVIIIALVFKRITTTAAAAAPTEAEALQTSSVFKWHMNGNTCDEIHF